MVMHSNYVLAWGKAGPDIETCRSRTGPQVRDRSGGDHCVGIASVHSPHDQIIVSASSRGRTALYDADRRMLRCAIATVHRVSRRMGSTITAEAGRLVAGVRAGPGCSLIGASRWRIARILTVRRLIPNRRDAPVLTFVGFARTEAACGDRRPMLIVQTVDGYLIVPYVARLTRGYRPALGSARSCFSEPCSY